MAKATLPTNFKDDILASSMGSKRRYNVINNSDGTISLEDVTDYTQVGSTFGAAQINATNKAANAAADASKIIDDYDTLMANTQAGYMAGALAVKKLNSNLVGKVKFGSFTGDGSSAKRIDCGFKPSKIIVYSYASTSNCRAFYYDQIFSTSVTYTSYLIPSEGNAGTDSISSSGNYFRVIDENGFEIGRQLNSSGHNVTWVAIE